MRCCCVEINVIWWVLPLRYIVSLEIRRPPDNMLCRSATDFLLSYAASSGQFFSQSSGYKCWRLTTELLFFSMSTHSSVPSFVPFEIAFLRYPIVVPHFFAKDSCSDTESAFRKIRNCSMRCPCLPMREINIPIGIHLINTHRQFTER